MSKFSENDKQKLEKLLSMLRTEKIDKDKDDVDFLCTHCHCKVCSTIKEPDKQTKI
jgi:hypothetical protein